MTDIFISYSHKDEVWKDALQQQLRVLEKHSQFSVWDDRQIIMGNAWLPAIKNAISQAKVVVLLVSSDLLASEFVNLEEIPEFLKRREQEGLRIVPVIVRPCAWRTVPWLVSLQGATKDNKPLSIYALGSYELEQTFTEITEKIHNLLTEANRQERRKKEELKRIEQEQQKIKTLAKLTASKVDAAYNLNNPLKNHNKIEEERIFKEQLAIKHAIGKQHYDAYIKEQLLIKNQQQLLNLHEEKKITEEIKNDSIINKEQSQNQIKIKWKTLRSIFIILLTLIGYDFIDNFTIKVIEPDMVNIPAGSFTMGCVEGRDNLDGDCPITDKLSRYVNISSFWLGKYEVTFKEWDVCVKAFACNRLDDAGWGRERRPVINVNASDAQTYIEWLNKRTGKNYRLPTESEWEYVARGGRNSLYPWGDNNINCAKARYGSTRECMWASTATVGYYLPNSFGLYDLAGNVWELTQSQYYDGYTNEATGKNYVLRGGSWQTSKGYLRSYTRQLSIPDGRSVGFRLALDE